ncbi:hypothetical protein EYB45_02400 [Erythrobacteraceae bacterium CFH 75059]|nr:hypothetical protein EYB45_02400 [Erythrobacteraceae bacterium CFH 75059]
MPWLAVCVVWVAAALAYALLRWEAIGSLRFFDTDDALRMVQVRDLLSGQAWFDLRQTRIVGLGDGPMHWSRLVDLPLAASVAGLTPLLGAGGAERMAATLVPLLLLFATMAIAARIASQFLDTAAAVAAAIALAAMPIVFLQFGPLRIDHHGWQALLLLAATWALSWRNAARGAFAAGAAMAAGTSISLELLPMAAVVGAVFACRWMCSRRDGAHLLAYLQTLAAGLVLLFLLTRGVADLAPHCDAIAPPHLALFSVVALGVGVVVRLKHLALAGQVGALALTAAAAGAVFAAAAPQCVGSPFGQLDPLVHRYWYLNVKEGMPLWEQPAKFVLLALPPVILGIAGCAMLAARSRDWLRRWWSEYLFVLVMATVAGLLTSRSILYASVLAAVPVGWLASRAFLAAAEIKRPVPKLACTAVVPLILLPALPVAMAEPVLAASNQQHQNREELEKGCDVTAIAATLNRLPPGMVLAQIDLGPHVLAHTRHDVMATGHHRGDAGMHAVIRTFTDPGSEGASRLATTGAHYVLACMPMTEMQIYLTNGHADSLAAMVHHSRTPPGWERVDVAPPFTLWRRASAPAARP